MDYPSVHSVMQVIYFYVVLVSQDRRKYREYIENHGLRFNPHKRICHIMGQNPFTTIPRWYINGVSLDIEDKLTYLGSILGVNGGKNTVKTVVEQHIVPFMASRGQELSLLV